VLVVNVEGVRKLYPVDELERAGVVHDRVGDRDVVIVDERVYFTEGRRFVAEGDALIEGRSQERFMIGEEALVAASGTRLPRVAAHRAYWVGAFAFYPGTEVWRFATPDSLR
jgi:hypothetical protein